MRRHVAAERGSALVTALMLTMIMLTVGLGGLAQVDVQQEQSGVERIRETTFNLGEGLLNTRTFSLSQGWLGPAAGAGGLASGPCTEASSSPDCPTAQSIGELFTSPDIEGLTAWRTEVRDNNDGVMSPCAKVGSAPSTFYSDDFTADQPGYDCNADDRLWVRAQATIRGRTRAVVALVQAERITYELPRAALLAGRLKIGNSGNKVLIEADTALGAGVMVRCTPTSGTVCVGHEGLSLEDVLSTTKLLKQLNGTTPQIAYDDPAALTADALAQLKRTAMANGTFYADCSDASTLAGEVVYVETCNRAYAGNTSINAPDAPGALIIENGTIDFQGNTAYFGLLYHANVDDSPGTLVKLTGNNGVTGAVFVEGQGGFEIQGSAYLTVDGRAFTALRSYGSAGIIQNTWREIPPGA